MKTSLCFSSFLRCLIVLFVVIVTTLFQMAEVFPDLLCDMSLFTKTILLNGTSEIKIANSQQLFVQPQVRDLRHIPVLIFLQFPEPCRIPSPGRLHVKQSRLKLFLKNRIFKRAPVTI